jgi:hypothetical protein
MPVTRIQKGTFPILIHYPPGFSGDTKHLGQVRAPYVADPVKPKEEYPGRDVIRVGEECKKAWSEIKQNPSTVGIYAVNIKEYMVFWLGKAMMQEKRMGKTNNISHVLIQF